MSNWFPEILQGTIVQIIVSLIIAMALAFWGRLKDAWPWPTAVFYALVTVTCLIFLFRIFWQPSNKVRIRKWVETTGFSVQTRDESSCEFFYVVTDEQGVRLNVYQPKKQKYIILEVRLVPSEEIIKKFEGLSPAQRDEFVVGAGLELLRYGIGFSDLKELKSVRLIDQVSITSKTSEFDFVSRMFFVRNSGKFLNLLFNKLTQP